MVDVRIDAAKASNLTDRVEDVAIPSVQLDSPQDQKETEHMNDQWGLQLGIYKTIPEFKIALDMRAIWTVGEKIEADPETTVILDFISGWGKDNFRTILKNLLTVKRLGQDSYAQIVRDRKSGKLINLKPLSPAVMKQIYNRKGRIIRYEQIDRITKKTLRQFPPSEIFHLTNKRIADELHGVADSDALKQIIEASNESFSDVRQLMHRHVRPMMKFILDTDDEAEIDNFIKKYDSAVNKGENMYFPKETVEHDLIAVPSNATLNPMPWREHLRNYFFQVVGMPQIIMGSSGEFTESTAKIAYLAFEVSVRDEQVDTMEQIFDQLGLEVTLKFTKSLQNELLAAKEKEPSQLQPNDTTAGRGE